MNDKILLCLLQHLDKSEEETLTETNLLRKGINYDEEIIDFCIKKNYLHYELEMLENIKGGYNSRTILKATSRGASKVKYLITERKQTFKEQKRKSVRYWAKKAFEALLLALAAYLFSLLS